MMSPNRLRAWRSLALPLSLVVFGTLHCGPRPSARAPHQAASSHASTSRSAVASASASTPKPAPSVVASASASASSSVISSSALPQLPDPGTIALDTTSTTARVTFLSAVIGPGRIGGAQWDRLGIVPDTVWHDVSKALQGTDPYSAVMGYIADGGFSSLGKPDIKGRVTLLAPTGDKTLNLPVVDDSFTPRWQGIEFRYVPLDRRTRLRIEIADAAASSGDPTIGIAELDGAALMKIDDAGKIVAWPFADQTANQLLFVMVSVIPE